MVAMFTCNFNAFRFYDSDGGEAASTQLAAQDANHSINADSDVAFQLRIRIDEVGGVDGTTMDDYICQYAKNGGAAVTLTTVDSGDGIRAVAAGLTNDALTTNRSSDPISDPGGGAFVAGEQSNDGTVDDRLLTGSDFSEHVFGVEIVAANVADTDYFEFTISGACDNNNVTPRMTVVKSAGAQTISGTVGEISTGEALPTDAVLAAAAVLAITGTVGEIASAEAFEIDNALALAAVQAISGTVGEIATEEAVPSDLTLADVVLAITGTVGEISTGEVVPSDVNISIPGQPITDAGAIATDEAVPSQTLALAPPQAVSGTVGEISTGEVVPADQAVALSTPQAISGAVGEIATGYVGPSQTVTRSTTQLISGTAGAIASAENVPVLIIAIEGSGDGYMRRMRRIGLGIGI